MRWSTKLFFYENVLFTTQLSYHLVRKLLKKIINGIYDLCTDSKKMSFSELTHPVQCLYNTNRNVPYLSLLLSSLRSDPTFILKAVNPRSKNILLKDPSMSLSNNLTIKFTGQIYQYFWSLEISNNQMYQYFIRLESVTLQRECSKKILNHEMYH